MGCHSIEMRRESRHHRLAGAIAGAFLALGCGSSGAQPGFGDGGTPTASDDGGDAQSDDAPILTLDSGQFTAVFAAGDTGASAVTFACEPGTYSGTFTTTVTTDAGLFPSLLSFSWNGTLTIQLVGHVTHDSSGENFAAPVLTIAPGAMLSGTDNFGGHFIAGLAGQLDCPTKKLTGTLANGLYEYPSDGGSITMQGTLSGTYAATTPPALTMGQISVGSAQISSLGANGTWSATLQ